MPRRAFHLAFAFLLVVCVLLYGRAGAAASAEPSITPAPLGTTQAARKPHLALLLPAGSESFARAAASVQAGFMEALGRRPDAGPEVRMYPVGEDPQTVIAAYRQALDAGAVLVVGPLTRNGVTALATAGDLISVPTLVLNVPDRAVGRTAKLYMLSLHIEEEARQVAQLALSEGRRRAFTINEQTPLARRMRDAFVQAFERGGGHHIAEYGYTTDAGTLERMRQASKLGVADMVFLAVHASRMRIVRSQMPELTAYGTSQINPGSTPTAPAPDVSDVRFVDMPWMVQPDHPAVMVFARAGARESDDLERLYALGIDAYRVAEELLAGRQAIDLDGVTGRLTLGADGRLRRGLLVTLIDGGRLVVIGETQP